MSYRAGLLRCPACGEGLEPVAHGAETVDVCPACAGVWVDWFDGAIAEVSRAVESHRPAGSSRPLPQHTCPRCTAPLIHELSGGDAAQGALGEPWVERCGECGGAFVPKEAVGLFATAPAPDDGSEAAGAAGLWGRLATALHALFGARD